jgi:hypothetical protein
MAIAKGTQVQQILPAPITGTVERYDVDQETGEIQYLVRWTDETGEHEKFFKEGEIEAI